MTRYLRAIYAPEVGVRVSNQDLLAKIASRFEALEISDTEKTTLFDFVRLLLIGTRYRYCQCERFLWLDRFAERAAAFEAAIEESTTAICEEINSSGSRQPFDAVIGVSSEGLLLPGMAERVARKLKSTVGRNAMHLDFCNGGCTASVRAMQLACTFIPEIKNVLIVVAEPTSALADPKCATRSNWQGVCTFGDGAAGIWISNEAGEGAVALDKMSSWRGEETDLIRWDYGTDYYRFAIAELEQFEVKVRREVLEAMAGLQIGKEPGARWAIHPAGIMLLLSLAKKLGLDRATLEPSLNHFRSFSNMSSASILHILKEIVLCAEPGQVIRWLSMGAGFNVASGSGVRV